MVNWEKKADVLGVLEIVQPFFYPRRSIVARPIDRFGGVGVETFQRFGSRTIFVVVAFNAGDVHGPDFVQAFLGIWHYSPPRRPGRRCGCIFASRYPPKPLGRPPNWRDIGDNGVLHSFTLSRLNLLRISKREIHFLPQPSALVPAG